MKELKTLLYVAAGSFLIAFAITFRNFLLGLLKTIVPADGVIAEFWTLMILLAIITIFISAGIKVRR